MNNERAEQRSHNQPPKRQENAAESHFPVFISFYGWA
jgi:hypothetical protein